MGAVDATMHDPCPCSCCQPHSPPPPLPPPSPGPHHTLHMQHPLCPPHLSSSAAASRRAARARPASTSAWAASALFRALDSAPLSCWLAPSS